METPFEFSIKFEKPLQNLQNINFMFLYIVLIVLN